MAYAPPPAADPAAVRVLFFGKLGDRFGRARDVMIPPNGCSLSELKHRLADVEGGAQALAEPGGRSAVDREVALDDAVWVRPGQEVAFFSAFSGG